MTSINILKAISNNNTQKTEKKKKQKKNILNSALRGEPFFKSYKHQTLLQREKKNVLFNETVVTK